MPYAVLRLYTDSGPLVGVIREKRDDVETIMRAVPGFVMYGLVDTGIGAFSLSVCEDKAGTDASIKAAADWIKANLPDAKIAPPRVIEGDLRFSIEHKRGEPGPHAVLRIFSQPPEARDADQSSMGDEVRKLMTSTPGFRAFNRVVGDEGRGFSLSVCDDKTSADKISAGMRELVASRFPNFPPPEIIEGTGVFRIDRAAVPA